MSIITIFSASNSNEEKIADRVAHRLGYDAASAEVLALAAKRFNVTTEKLMRTMHGPVSVFNPFTREKERNIIYIKAALAEYLSRDDIVFAGFPALLAPENISHILRVCITASRDFRISSAVECGKYKSVKEAERAVRKDDLEAANWSQELHGKSPWDSSLYDVKLPMHKKSIAEAVDIICENALKNVVKTTSESQKAMEDFVLASNVHVELALEGHLDTDVDCENGNVTIIINKRVLRLEHIKRELCDIASRVAGVETVSCKVGPGFHKADIYRRQSFELPQKVLLVDDEAQFVETLSERLQMRDFGTAMAQNGEQALSMIETDEPEVMLLDLRMPGIDGIDVLRKLKIEHPEIEVIILTGHGTEKDRELAGELGAFAYLEKPVNIEKLSEIMKAAYSKVRNRNEDNEPSGDLRGEK